MKFNFKENFLVKRLQSPVSVGAGNTQSQTFDTISIDEIGVLIDFGAHGAAGVLTLQLQSSLDQAFTVPVNEGVAKVFDQAVSDKSNTEQLLNIDSSLLKNRFIRFDITYAGIVASIFGIHAVGLTNREKPVPQPSDTEGADLISNATV